MPRFNFEQQVVLTDSEYIRIFAVGRRMRALPVVVAVGAGIACLFWAYTVPLGIVLLLVAVIWLVERPLASFVSRSQYNHSPHLHKPITCGVSETEMWVKGPSFRFSSGWSNLTVWRESSGWLVLSPNGMTPVFLREADLRQAGVFEEVVRLAEQHAARFGSRRLRKTIDSRVEKTSV